MRSILRFVFVVVPTAVLATAVVVGVSRSTAGQAGTVDGDLQRDLHLASTASIELAPAGQPIATISALEAPRSGPERSARPKRTRTGSRVARARASTVTVASGPEVAGSTDDAEPELATDLAPEAVETLAEAPPDGGVALPRPTAIPVAFPGSDAGPYDPGPGTVVRGGGIDPDHCQIHRGRGRVGPPIFRQPRGPSLSDRIRGAQRARGSDESPRPSIGDRIRQASNSGSRSSGGSARSGGSSSTNRSIGDRIRAARGR